MASLVYNKGKTAILNGDIDLLTQDIKVALVTSSYSPDKDADDFFDDVTNEASGAGYTAGGKSLASKAVAQDNANDRAEFDADDLQWVVSTITARACVVYYDTGVDATSILIAYIDFGSDFSTVAETFTIEWDTEGILYLGE